MKFIFKGMERSDELELGPSILLSWHEKVQWCQLRHQSLIAPLITTIRPA